MERITKAPQTIEHEASKPKSPFLNISFQNLIQGESKDYRSTRNLTNQSSEQREEQKYGSVYEAGNFYPQGKTSLNRRNLQIRNSASRGDSKRVKTSKQIVESAIEKGVRSSQQSRNASKIKTILDTDRINADEMNTQQAYASFDDLNSIDKVIHGFKLYNSEPRSAKPAFANIMNSTLNSSAQQNYFHDLQQSYNQMIDDSIPYMLVPEKPRVNSPSAVSYKLASQSANKPQQRQHLSAIFNSQRQITNSNAEEKADHVKMGIIALKSANAIRSNPVSKITVNRPPVWQYNDARNERQQFWQPPDLQLQSPRQQRRKSERQMPNNKS